MGSTLRHIGQAERTFNTGFGKHVKAIRNNSMNSVYANRNTWDSNERHGCHKSWKKGKVIEAIWRNRALTCTWPVRKSYT